MFNPISNCTVISNERFAELIRKEEQISVIARMIEKNEYVSISDIKNIIGLTENTEQKG